MATQAAQACNLKNDGRLVEHITGQLLCLGTHTVTGVLKTCGRQFEDWTADYRLYQQGLASTHKLLTPVRDWACENTTGTIVVAMDDTCLRKSGRKIHGVKHFRDPLSPAFHTNLLFGQRFVQSSMAYQSPNGDARMIPVDWVHAPMPRKPRPKAPQAQWEAYKAARKEHALSAVGVERLGHLRQAFDAQGAEDRTMCVVVDGSYTNATILRNLPHNTTLIGRIRGDARLYHLPDTQSDKGRRRVYGAAAPTPKALQQDAQTPWEEIEVRWSGKQQTVRVKKLTPLRWRPAGKAHQFQLVCIAPTPYRLSKNANRLYRQPAYLLCTDPDMPLQQVVQQYLWRWDIEVNHRDEKTTLGVGEAQVRTKNSVQEVSGLAVAAYAMLLVAACQCQKDNVDFEHLPKAKWQKRNSLRPTTPNLIRYLRYEVWSQGMHFSGFVNNNAPTTKPEKYHLPINSPVFYADRHA